MSIRVAMLGLLLAGCAHRGAYRLPGPMTSLGEAPESAEDPAPDAVVDDDGADTDEAPSPAPGVARARRKATPEGRRVASAAGSFVGKPRLKVDGESYRYDCSGFVCASYAKAGLPVSGNSRALYAQALEAGVLHKRKVPQPGDIAFFDDTYDRDGNGRRDDPLTHVAVVESVDADGTAVLVHVGSKGVRRMAMNLRNPTAHTDANGDEINSYLRSGRDDGGPRLTGELFVAWGSLWAAPPDATADSE